MVDRMPVGKCFDVLKEKRINQEGWQCKKTIHAPLEDVVKVCEVGEMQKDEMKKSREKFNMTVCSATKQGNFPNCTYEGKIIEAKILIKCLQGMLPVHFHDSPNNGHSEVLFWSEK
uniref:Ribonuclease A-domain domain-containing protein n=1 Tax=Knipowitschia caucasica TaxID=637954 RepID=A0AAV2MHR7_KNICA